MRAAAAPCEHFQKIAFEDFFSSNLGLSWVLLVHLVQPLCNKETNFTTYYDIT